MISQPGFTRGPGFDHFRRQLRAARLWPRRRQADDRRSPDFIVIGGQKCGTTALHRYLCEHPDVIDPVWKEIHFFDLNWQRGLAHYKAHFPLRAETVGKFTGEATPYYLHHPLVAGRVAQTLPDIRLIAILREPAARAYSHYQHHARTGRETAATFEHALERERSFLAAEEARFQIDPGYRSYRHQHFGYFDRGLYAKQLRRWLEHFPAAQLLVLTLEELTADPAPVMRSAWQHIGLAPADVPATPPHNVGGYERPADDKLADLRARYSSHNDELRALLSRDLPW